MRYQQFFCTSYADSRGREHTNPIAGEKCITESLMTTLQSPRVPRAKLIAPQPDRLVADPNTSLGHKILDVAAAQIEAMIEPDRVLNDFGWESMTFVLIIGCTHFAIVAQMPLICQYH